ncbi:hypothetical protein NOVOSPHI9U_50491 [Novosphingobium sp. 9U]|nr:hypothetical protein NOVOSPHI9U_50491 [Novosphingobium sp. 9U]
MFAFQFDEVIEISRSSMVDSTGLATLCALKYPELQQNLKVRCVVRTLNNLDRQSIMTWDFPGPYD